MAGSLSWFVYTADDNSPYAINADESNIVAVNGDTFEWTTSDPVAAVPRNYRPRFAVYSNIAGTRNIRVPVLSPTAYLTIQADVPTIPDSIAGTGSLTFNYKRPEIIRSPKATDTGLISP
jgi:hypothetical protein